MCSCNLLRKEFGTYNMEEGGEEGEAGGSISQSDPLPHQECAGDEPTVQDPEAGQQILLGPAHRTGVAAIHGHLHVNQNEKLHFYSS